MLSALHLSMLATHVISFHSYNYHHMFVKKISSFLLGAAVQLLCTRNNLQVLMRQSVHQHCSNQH